MKVKLLDPKAKVPVCAHPDSDLGYDLFALEDVTLSANFVMKVRTGIAIEFPLHFGAILKDRSSMAAQGITVSGGVIDSGYRGEIIVLLTLNRPDSGHRFVHYDIKARDKIAQMLLTPCVSKKIKIVKELSDSSRGGKGFGSSGR